MNLKAFMTLAWYIMVVGRETNDLWLTCNWFNQNIISLIVVKFENNNYLFWTCFNHKGNEIYYN